VFRKDRWLCRWCLRPVIFPPAMRLLDQFVRSHGITTPLAFHQKNWRRDSAPLLDELGASVDHVQAHATGGSSDIENLATICAKCNARKGSLAVADHLRRHPLKPVRGKYGEPVAWDGMSSVFLVLVEMETFAATATEKQWALALRRHDSGG
jgi:5-methylcytosine-specific restriction endonuclease McrA